MAEVLRPEDNSGRSTSSQRDTFNLFGQIEWAIAVGIAVILSLTAVLALAGAVTLVWNGVVQWPHIGSLFWVVDRLLFVMMVVEILHTVRSSIQSHEIASEPFLIVGIIAAIRRILVITLETSDKPAESQLPGTSLSFDHAMIELGILAALILVLAIAICLLRRARAGDQGS